jgi:hypothetical protein
MKGPRRQWWGGVAGILCVLSLAAASLLVRHSPSTDQPTADITSYFTANRASALLAAYLLGFGATTLLFYLGALRQLLGRDQEFQGLADVAFAAGVAVVSVVVVGSGVLAVLAFRPDTTPAVARVLYDANGLLIAFVSFPAAAFLASASAVTIRSGVLPSWLGWAGWSWPPPSWSASPPTPRPACSGPRAIWWPSRPVPTDCCSGCWPPAPSCCGGRRRRPARPEHPSVPNPGLPGDPCGSAIA